MDSEALKAGLVARGNTRTSSELPWRKAALISEWRAPTDFLLEFPAQKLKQPSPN